MKHFYQYKCKNTHTHSINLFRQSNLGSSIRCSDNGIVGGEFSLSSSLSNTMMFSNDPPSPISKSSDAAGEVSIPGLKTASISNWGFSQKISTFSNFENAKFLVSTSRAPALSRTSSFSSNVPCWLRGFGRRATWLPKNSCLGDIYNFQTGRQTSRKLVVISWTNFFTIRITKCEQKSRPHCILSLDTAKIMLLECAKWDCMKSIKSWKSSSFFQPMRIQHVYTIYGVSSSFFGLR